MRLDSVPTFPSVPTFLTNLPELYIYPYIPISIFIYKNIGTKGTYSKKVGTEWFLSVPSSGNRVGTGGNFRRLDGSTPT